MPVFSRPAAFPLPLYDVPAPSPSHSRRSQRRAALLRQTLNTANTVSSVLNSMFVPECESASAFPSLLQSRLSDSVFTAARRWSRCLATSKCDEPCWLSEPQMPLPPSLDLAVPSVSYAARSRAVPIIASKVALPERAGTVDLLTALPPEVAARYADLGTIVAPPDGHNASAARVFGSQAEYLALLRRMLPAGMLAFTQQPAYVNSLFAVPKDDGALRLILDARPVCDASAEPPDPELPDPSVLCGLSLPGKTRVYTAKTDLANAFFIFRLPASWQPHFAIPAVRAGDLGLPDYPPDALVFPCLTVLPMGWSHSCYLLQQAHLRLVQELFPASALITRSADPALDRLRICVYLDDVSWFGPSADLVNSAVRRYLDLCEQRHWPVKLSKCKPASLRGVESLGCAIDGVDGTIGVAPAKLLALIRRTQLLLAGNYATGREVASLLGSWTWAALARRPAGAVLGRLPLRGDRTRPPVLHLELGGPGAAHHGAAGSVACVQPAGPPLPQAGGH